MGPYQPSEVASDLSGLEAGRFELDENEVAVTRKGRIQNPASPGQGQRVPQGQTFVDARSIQSIQIGISPNVAHHNAMQFADSVRSATMHEAEMRHHQAVQDMTKYSLEHTQNVSARVADHVKHETLAEAESQHQQLMREAIAQAERVHAQSLDDVRSHALSRESPVVLELQSQIAHLTRLDQDLSARLLQAAGCSGSLRALSAGGDQDRSDKGSNVEAFDLFGRDEPDPPQSNANDSVNQVLAVLREEVQNLRDELSKKKGGRSKKQKDSTSSSDESSSSESDPGYANERKLMRLKGFDEIKTPQLPKTAAEMRGGKNSLISHLVTCCKSNESKVLNWLSGPLEGQEDPSKAFPVLNRVPGTKLLEASKSGRFGVDFQALQELSVCQGNQVQGHILLGRICKKFCLDKERGMSLSQQHLGIEATRVGDQGFGSVSGSG